MHDKILIRDFMLDASIGIYEHEKKAPQPILVNAEIAVKAGPHPEDEIEHVLSYEHVVRDISALVESRHFNLVETLAEEIASLCLKDPRALAVVVRLEKTECFKNIAGVGIEIARQKSS